MSASPSPVAAVAAVAAATPAPSKWQRLVALARLLRDQLRRYREVAPVAGDQTAWKWWGFGSTSRVRWFGIVRTLAI